MGPMRERREARRGRGMEGRGDRSAAVAGATRISYGASEAQRILLWPASRSGNSGARPPLAVYVHGGGWHMGNPERVSDKPAFFNSEGWAFASIGYRYLPEAPVETQAADVGAALRLLRSEAAARGYDPDRILLMGHSAGAHLAALVATDPRYAGDAFAAIRGVIPIDGAGYDVPLQMQLAGRFMLERTYRPAFGDDLVRQRALSPITHVGGPDAPDWLLLFVTARDDARRQSDNLAAALARNGARAQSLAVESGSGELRAHMAINVEFGRAGYPANDAVRALMRRIEGAQ
jgi:acetyl esterase/lipase